MREKTTTELSARCGYHKLSGQLLLQASDIPIAIQFITDFDQNMEHPEHPLTTCRSSRLQHSICNFIVFDEGIDDIPSAGAPPDKFLCCDVCMRKEDKRKLTQIYCIICQKKFCQSHMIVSACDTPFLHSLRPKARFCWG